PQVREINYRHFFGVSAGVCGIEGRYHDLSVTYTQTGGTILPGYGRGSNFFGASGGAPGFPFMLGWQDWNFPEKAARNNWLVHEEQLNSSIEMTSTKSIQARGVFEPFQGFKLTLSALRSFSENKSMYFTWDPVTNSYPDEYRSPLTIGDYSISILALGTSFEKSDKSNNYYSAVFERFKNNRTTIASRRATELRGKDVGYSAASDGAGGYDGYNVAAQQVMIPAFYAAYTGRDPDKVPIIDFPDLWTILPNGDVSFDGLSNIPFVKQYFKSVILKHSYKAVYRIGGYASNLDYDLSSAVSHVRDMQNNFIPRNDITSARIEEAFGPLGGIDLTFLNSLSTRFEIKRTRSVSIGMTNLQLAENKTQDYVVGMGYVFNDVS
ncbi:hypothetical protein EZS27_036766, partial [termite gut metagenome]